MSMKWMIFVVGGLAVIGVAVETGSSPFAAKGPLPEPAIFAEGAISTGDYNLNSAFTPDGHTLYLTFRRESGKRP